MNNLLMIKDIILKSAKPTLHAKENPLDQLVNFIQNLSSTATAIAIAIAVLSIVCFGLAVITGGVSGLQKNKPWAFAIVIGLTVVCLAPGLVIGITNAIGV